ncbi:hypothetical protein KNV35_gp71 [uncultured phage cr8_1]|uniref:Uncharacterized protein n=1 Tax=uncultured phage cr8_1 TaxID=2772068 RepID=A0A7M1RXJ4_9CAUD|nr:hypothetical protein KNV35_gp71 [uncultured phage cr8_1]QOR58864.1 hypothetical protein [uncultured phage cr8_1]
MDISEMHQMFRQYAQQMGMQNVRAIMPEQIDLLINNSISDTINQVITQNIGITNDRVISDASKLNQVNALKSLYKVWKGNIADVTIKGKEKTSYIISFQLPLNNFKTTGSYTDDGNSSTAISFLYMVDLSINYKKSDFVTNVFPVRIVDDQFVADVVNDFVLAPTMRSPVASIHDNLVELYIDKADAKPEDRQPFTFKGVSINELRISYIAKPAVVRFAEDVDGTNVDCDLPEYMHVDIVKHAVELYQLAKSGSLAAAQQAQQNQQREQVANNYREDGNQRQ